MFRVIVTPECRAELKELRKYITVRESRHVASRYLKRLKEFMQTLSIAPHRGEHREGIKFDQRTIGFDRRVTVIFEVDEANRVVNIAGIRYGGRGLEQHGR